ncbi:bifunctional diaminohydroxyphosphoribosylaminopyrimidine deaminase/5-amino-6-(5-phosphoribosylamino)uracil reductase RibD [Polynucleobacter sp. AP-Kolm-20A-A1]|uniref:bifunctional diaminohydroxyphosphoribosylaminopyrimidine deaminase/5-amino-6-(5-phosphoribosylamino)uracil reductase RibD n=1 Tax=Polynucleobacter sp. AP-Kolm-20A-A1 TaxID=2081041 RepID=UPI001BFEB523|nr:bifunctional diaminohydroxyphosphoribosylaminopyrimidine deaminase/5-amino-6-(5-phosphoribosylamino)uracil reductase RibD [Polynucleobacter sp. AP-Kolm-20A-A1]QWE20879.1 bifunctional diaminohydroxyphosphoribosylaminopyrimidine deaminase/5-amino-6-(5-phosphoribosylamino)uracil reductase RibD [Polynucleobacter sp. AP-Kolm-20A-A1]
MYSAVDHQFMSEALAEAQKALYLSNPNPRVGCVIVKDGKIIGRGFTQQVGGPHAEIQALADAKSQGIDPAGATIYVTLEPCSHTGRTPPCVDALVAAKPAKVIAAMLDPNPLVSGTGLERLQAAGIEVQCGLMESEAQTLNRGFISRMTRGLPWVRMKIAASLDGKTALPDGRSQWITGPLARADGHHWRAQACAIVTGVGTVKEDDPSLNVREVLTQRQPWRVIVDSKLETPLTAKILNDVTATSGVIIMCASLSNPAIQEKAKAFQERGVEVVAMANEFGKVDLPKLFSYLAKERGMNEVHIESGFKLNGSMLREGCVDELLLYYAPFFMGEGIGMANVSTSSLDLRQDWRIMDQRLFGPDLRLRYIKN